MKNVWKHKNVLCFFKWVRTIRHFWRERERDFLNNIFFFYFDRLQKRIFNHMTLPEQSFVFLSYWNIHFWLWCFLLKMFTIEWHFVLFLLIWLILCFVLYTEIMHWRNGCMTKYIQLCIFLHLIVYFVSVSDLKVSTNIWHMTET